MTIAYTVCSLNHLAGAIVLGHSLRRFHPHWHFVIGLCDRLEGRVAIDAISFPVLEIESVAGVADSGLIERYTAFELNCAAKPYLAAHLLEAHPEADRLIFADSDIQLYASLEPVEHLLATAALVLSPHRISPSVSETSRPAEESFNIWGLYNAGFFALRRGGEATAFLSWWRKQTQQKCFVLIEEGLVVDQIWLNFAPVYFREVALLLDAGCNVAYWNLDERNLREEGGQLITGAGMPLRFFHFSGFDWRTPGKLTARFPDLSHAGTSALRKIQHEYASMLAANDAERFGKLPYAFEARRQAARALALGRLPLSVRWSLPLRRLVRRLGFGLVHRYRDERLLSGPP